MNDTLTAYGISPLAQIHPNAIIGKNVDIGPFTFIDQNVVINDNSWIGPNVTIFSGARIGSHCRIFPGAVIAGIPQDLKFAGEETTVEIGDYTTIRECVTVNRGTKYAFKTAIGSHCLLMAYVHVAHDCMLGNHIILANSVNLAGHVEIEDFAILEGLVAVQQFIRIGQHSFVGGGSLVRKNIPPFIKAAREPLSYMGVNKIGLDRRGFDKATIVQIQDIYRLIFLAGLNTTQAIEQINTKFAPGLERDAIIYFIENSPKGIIRGLQSISSNGKSNGKHTTQ